MEQIIGAYKEYIVIPRIELDKIEQSAKNKLEVHTDRPLSEGAIEARSVLSVIEWIKENNIYNRDFEFKR
jgi:hypothetical protein